MKMRSVLTRAALCTAILSLAALANSAELLVSDTRDAFTRINAIQALFVKVDTRIKAIRASAEQQSAPLKAELERLRADKAPERQDANRQLKAKTLLKLAEIQRQAAADQQQVGLSNEQALAQIDVVITAVEAQIKAERKALAVLKSQDAIYFNPNCSCNITEEVYKRVNLKLPTTRSK